MGCMWNHHRQYHLFWISFATSFLWVMKWKFCSWNIEKRTAREHDYSPRGFQISAEPFVPGAHPFRSSLFDFLFPALARPWNGRWNELVPHRDFVPHLIDNDIKKISAMLCDSMSCVPSFSSPIRGRICLQSRYSISIGLDFQQREG